MHSWHPSSLHHRQRGIDPAGCNRCGDRCLWLRLPYRTDQRYQDAGDECSEPNDRARPRSASSRIFLRSRRLRTARSSRPTPTRSILRHESIWRVSRWFFACPIIRAATFLCDAGHMDEHLIDGRAAERDVGKSRLWRSSGPDQEFDTLHTAARGRIQTPTATIWIIEQKHLFGPGDYGETFSNCERSSPWRPLSHWGKSYSTATAVSVEPLHRHEDAGARSGRRDRRRTLLLSTRRARARVHRQPGRGRADHRRARDTGRRALVEPGRRIAHADPMVPATLRGRKFRRDRRPSFSRRRPRIGAHVANGWYNLHRRQAHTVPVFFETSLFIRFIGLGAIVQGGAVYPVGKGRWRS